MDLLYIVAAQEKNGPHFVGDLREVYWGSIAFFVVAGLLIWKVGPIVKEALADRTSRIEQELNEAKQARAEAEAALTSSSADLPDLADEEERIRVEAATTAQKLKVDLVARAEAEAESTRERGRAEVANRKRQAQADLAAEISELTRRGAEAVVVDGLDPKAQNQLIENYINEVGQM